MILILISYKWSRSLLCAPEIHYLSYTIETFINSLSSKYGESCNCIFNSPKFLRRFRGNYPTEKGESNSKKLLLFINKYLPMWLLDCEQSFIFFKVAGVTDTHRKQVTKIISELESLFISPQKPVQ